jgi:hypothetical protein
VRSSERVLGGGQGSAVGWQHGRGVASTTSDRRGTGGGRWRGGKVVGVPP